MLVLHYLPKVQPEPEIINTFYEMFGKEPKTIEKFIQNNSKKFT